MVSSRSADRADRVLDAAAALIARYGYARTAVGDVAEAAGVSKGAVYLEFSSKEELLTALLAREARALLADVLRRIEADPQGGTLAGVYRHTLLALAGNPLMRALYTRDSAVLGEYVRRQPPSRYADRLVFGRAFVERMQLAGLVRDDLGPELVTHLMAVVGYGLMSIETVVPESEAPPLEEVAAGLAEVVQRGLGAPGGDSAAGKTAMAQLIASISAQYDARTSRAGSAAGDDRASGAGEGSGT